MKFLVFSKERIPFYITLVVVIGLGCSYYFVYLPKNEEDMKAWKFRSLQKIDKNIHAQIKTGHKQLNIYLKSCEGKNRSGNYIENLNNFLTTLQTENFPIGAIITSANKATKTDTYSVETTQENEQIIERRGAKERQGNQRPAPDYSLEESSENKKTVKRFSGLGEINPGSKVSFNLSSKQLDIHETYIGAKNVYQLSLNYEFENFIKPLLSTDVFDQYIVVGDSTILYETFFSGLTVSRDSTLKKNGTLTGAAVVDREYGGIKYKLFVQPVSLINNTNILVIGLLSYNHYYNTKTRLPPQTILFLIIVFTCILVTFPFIKLYQLRDEDRLTLSDALSVTIVSMLVVSLLFWVFIKYSPSDLDDKSKSILAEKIKESYVNEINTNFDVLHQLNRLVRKDGFKQNFADIGKQNYQRSKGNRRINEINSILKNIELDRVFWMKANGLQGETWTSDTVEKAFSGNFSERPYFKSIMNNKAYQLADRNDSTFYVQPVISWISGEFLTNISIPSRFDNYKVTLMGFKIKSLDHLKIPPGYTFAMIDPTGEVLYHSNSTKNLNENLFEEFSESNTLRYSMNTGSSESFNAQYYGNEYDAMVTPVGGGIPYYLVILRDRVFEEYREVNVFCFTISLQFLIFMLVVIQILIMFFASAVPSPYKGKSFQTDWIGPKKSSNLEYVLSTGFNIFIFLGLCFFPYNTLLCEIFMLLSGISAIPLFLNLLFAQKYYQKDSPSKWYKLKAGLWGSSLTIVLNIVAVKVLKESICTFLAFESLLIAVAIFLVLVHRQLLERIAKKNDVKEWRKFDLSYSAVLFSWMLVVMGFPIIIFYVASYNYDQHIIARYNQLAISKANVLEATPGIRSHEGNDSLKIIDENNLSGNIYPDSFWLSRVTIDTIGTNQVTKAEDSTIVDLFQLFHIYKSERLPDGVNLNKAFSENGRFNDLMTQVVSARDSTITDIPFNGKHVVISSASLNFRLPFTWNYLKIFWLFFFVIALTAFFFIFYRMIKKIFSIEITPISPNAYTLNSFTDFNLNSHIFHIGFTGIGVHEFVDYLLDITKMPTVKRFTIDLSLILDINGELNVGKLGNLNYEDYESNYDLVILNHFEFGAKNVNATYFKLILLENLLRKLRKTKILIVSTMDPSAMLDIVLRSQEKNKDHQTLERWSEVLGKFRIELNRVSMNRVFHLLKLKRGDGLQDSFAYQSLVTYYHFYLSIWQSLSNQEKFFVYDLAEDGLVNSYDKQTLSLLLNKGLIIQRNGRLRLFTKGFRNFVVAGLSEMEMVKLIEKIEDNSNWNRIRVPLVMILMAILLFILWSQQETSTKLITSLGALSAAIPALVNFLSTLGGVNPNKKPGS